MFSLMPRRRERREGAPLMREHTPFDLLRREFGSMFDRFFPAWPAPFEFAFREMEPWGLEMEELEREYVFRAELPGFAPNEVEVQLVGDMLTIRAEHIEKVEEKGKEPVERRHGLWERSLTLPAGVVPEKIEARCHNGVLEVHVPKAPELAPRRIEVKT
jgi:HSP20 family protein